MNRTEVAASAELSANAAGGAQPHADTVYAAGLPDRLPDGLRLIEATAGTGPSMTMQELLPAAMRPSNDREV